MFILDYIFNKLIVMAFSSEYHPATISLALRVQRQCMHFYDVWEKAEIRKENESFAKKNRKTN